MTPDDHLLQDKVCLVKVEDQVKLADVAEIAIEYLHKLVNDIQNNQFIVVFFNTSCKV